MKHALRSPAVCIALCSFLPAIAPAQTAPPPRHSSVSPTGVSFLDGAFSLEEQDLSIGGGLPAGISLTRSYNSGTDGLGDPFGSIGWTNNLNVYLTISALARNPNMEYPENFLDQCIYNIAGGSSSIGFIYAGGARTWQQTGCGPYAGTYLSMSPSGALLEYTLQSGTYRYRYTSADGAVINFNTMSPPRATDWTFADGTRLDFTYASNKLKAVFSNRGWAILFESNAKACAVNAAHTYVTPASNCPANAQEVSYTYVPGVNNPFLSRLVTATKGGSSWTYQYAPDTDHLSCIKDPGQSVCRVQNSYYRCPPVAFPQGNIRLPDPVTSQTFADGRVINYALDQNRCPDPSTDGDYRPFNGGTTTMTETGIPGTTVAAAFPSGHLLSFKDPLGRTRTFAYQSPMLADGYVDLSEQGDIDIAVAPEGDRIDVYTRDIRGNIAQRKAQAKPGSGLPEILSAVVYPASCSNRWTCNKPTSVTNANGNTTTYAYDANHGGVLTETGPAVNGVGPQKRYEYAQRYAWIRNAAGTGYVQAATPVWVKTREEYCRVTAASAGNCAGGAADEVITDFDYGPASGPNNLLPRGVAVTAGGQTLRTCYGYDTLGRKISETKPAANLGVCP